MTDTPADTLRKAKVLISDPENWNKDGGYFKDDDPKSGCMCIFSAISTAMKPTPNIEIAEQQFGPLLHDALPDGFEGDVFDFNDDPNTTHPDMMAFLDRAIAIAEKHND